ncbi:uncharacterized protein LOC131161372 isoform X2 [Malania oleifera]|uniref:uncharacterized protein LOC131161372 isoform X2 n=2 Tax=Malania oleifera TaxID=397392 RepID=UPI0025AE421F|nr:uncharacterized protein LOC131161372 isoform X2 [Malania oleifera]XP_057973087.1 uncharacterized protein LOC131161372 isoform X2 [Malania oleifera]
MDFVATMTAADSSSMSSQLAAQPDVHTHAVPSISMDDDDGISYKGTMTIIDQAAHHVGTSSCIKSKMISQNAPSTRNRGMCFGISVIFVGGFSTVCWCSCGFRHMVGSSVWEDDREGA